VASGCPNVLPTEGLDRFHQVRGITADIALIDERITKHAEHWKIKWMPTVDRNILRIAVYEMLRTETPPAVVIDEALELARQFPGRNRFTQWRARCSGARVGRSASKRGTVSFVGCYNCVRIGRE
jgi:hypothetical protein